MFESFDVNWSTILFGMSLESDCITSLSSDCWFSVILLIVSSDFLGSVILLIVSSDVSGSLGTSLSIFSGKLDLPVTYLIGLLINESANPRFNPIKSFFNVLGVFSSEYGSRGFFVESLRLGCVPLPLDSLSLSLSSLFSLFSLSTPARFDKVLTNSSSSTVRSSSLLDKLFKSLRTGPSLPKSSAMSDKGF